MKSKTQIFVDELGQVQADKILSIEILGSRKGENDLSISDIDILIICKSKKDTASVFKTALEIQEKTFEIKPTKVNRFIQKFFLGSNSYSGIHLIVLGRDELDNNFRPISLRLRFMTKLVGRNLFLYEIQQNHHLVYGKNLADEIKIEQPHFSEKLTCFIFPGVVLLFALPAFLFSHRTLKIWCFKAIKYHYVSLRAFITIAKQDYFIDDKMLKTAKFFRYKPDEYQGNPVVLYIQTWRNIFKNAPFLFSRKQENLKNVYERI